MHSPTESYADQLNIDTPEQVELRFPVAGLGSRFLAILTDSAIQFAFVVLVFIVLAIIGSAAPAVKPHPTTWLEKWIIAGFILLAFLFFWGYFSLFEAFWNGQTPGKRFAKIRVLKDSGRSITLFESMARNLLRVVDFQPGFYLAGVISVAVTRQNKRLGDLVAGTIVVHERTDEQPLMTHHRASTYNLSPRPASLSNQPVAVLATEQDLIPADAIARLRTPDLHVVDTFFNRALDLSVERREQLAARVAATLCVKMGIPVPQELPPERLLEQIAYRMRAAGR